MLKPVLAAIPISEEGLEIIIPNTPLEILELISDTEPILNENAIKIQIQNLNITIVKKSKATAPFII